MAYSFEQRYWCQGVLRLGFVFVCACLGVYIVGRSLLWRLEEKSRVPCPSCLCDCSSHTDFLIPPGCSENDPDLSEELEKDTVALLSEEIALQKIVNNDARERALALTIDTKRASSHYQKEAGKCIAGVETCEEARERAEAQLGEELKLTALWQKRASQLGWRR
ncbi:putative 39S ribosomal protein L45 [Hibiscus syriacus]|uniref:39S ribosomal protein L45 n=1 Tax=Hibiscus syriacus TaxID=106335 RepID=A0A6A2XPQ2_HIBSY|nr:putative 39S ribosomal protein L45 [Hibiscus syriacus]